MTFKMRLMTFILLCLYQVLNLIASFWLFTTCFSGSKIRARRIHLAYDQLGAATIGWDEDETMSSRMGRTGEPVWMKNFTDWLFLHLDGQVNHCESKIEPRFK